MEFSELNISDCLNTSAIDLCQSIVNEVKRQTPVTIVLSNGVRVELFSEGQARQFLWDTFKWQGKDV
jgi:hypothetical protein